jgi:nitrite reductase/ring-hydroxylating ferredoxin subunit
VDFPGDIRSRPEKRSRLAAEPYFSREHLELEWDRIWTRTWLFAGIESDLEEPGDYFVYEIGRESILVMRDERNQLSAFYNVCQHRGNRIFANDRGSVAEVSCPYHGWTYDLDGRLKRVPDIERFKGGVSADERSLKPVKVETFAGMVFVNMNPDAAPLRSFLGLIAEQLAPFRFEDMLVVKQQTVSLGANWKTAKDNFLEQYHVDFIHPQHASLVDCCNSDNELWPYGHSRTMVEGFVTNPRYPIPEDPPIVMKLGLSGLGLDPEQFNGRLAEVRGAVPEQKRRIGAELGYDYSGLSDDQLTDIWQYDLFPNLFMTVRAEELWIFGPRPHPTDPDQCYFDKWTLQIPKEVAFDEARGYSLGIDPSMARETGSERPDREVFTREDVIEGRSSMTITVDQDIYYLNGMQAGMHSRGFDHAVLNEDEVRVQHFHDWVDEWLSRDPLSD